jgi:hypothetical protein
MSNGEIAANANTFADSWRYIFICMWSSHLLHTFQSVLFNRTTGG